jgi:hypothetical protein
VRARRGACAARLHGARHARAGRRVHAHAAATHALRQALRSARGGIECRRSLATPLGSELRPRKIK